MTQEQSIDKSVQASHEAGTKYYPNRKDYEEYYIRKGITTSTDQIWSNPQHVVDIQRHWHMQGQNGCVFAQAVAHSPEKHGWDTNVVTQTMIEEGDSSLITRVDQVIQDTIADPNNELVSLLFPSIDSPEGLVQLLHTLDQTRSINITQVEDHDGISKVALRVPLAEGIVQSWLVAFAPLDYLPETRKAPVTEIAVRTKLKPDVMFHMLTQTEDEAHLADVPTGFSDKVMERLWQSTYQRTREVLGGDEARKANPFASAKVTIAVPTILWINHSK